MKVCKDCGEMKSFSCFYKHKQNKDGFLNKCKTCVKARVGRHRDANLEKIQEYDRNRPNKEARHEDNKQRYKDKRKEGDEVWLEKDRKRLRLYREKHPLQDKARTSLNNAVRDGKVSKPTVCEHCAIVSALQGHHWSYDEVNWLNVIWLCTKCHGNEHKRLNGIKRNKL